MIVSLRCCSSKYSNSSSAGEEEQESYELFDLSHLNLLRYSTPLKVGEEQQLTTATHGCWCSPMHLKH